MKKLLLVPTLTISLASVASAASPPIDLTANTASRCATRSYVIYDRTAVSCRKAKRVLRRFDSTGSAPSGWSCSYSDNLCTVADSPLTPTAPSTGGRAPTACRPWTRHDSFVRSCRSDSS